MTTAPAATVTPTGVVVAPPGLDREQWLAARRTGIGGSDIAAVLGMSKYTSPLELYLDKTGELGDVPRSPELEEAAFWGHQHEPTIARVFAERTGLGVVEGPGMLAHVERRWMLANVDRYVIEPGERMPSSLLEIKTRSAFQLDEWLLGVPDGPALQTHWYLAVTGYSHAHVAALLGGNRLVIHRVEHDEQLVEHLVALVGEFWQRVLDRTPPPVDGSEATEELLGHLYKVKADAVTVADPAEVLPLLERRRELKAREQRTADELREVDNRLKAVAGEAEIVKVQGRVAFTWKQNGPLAAKRFAAAHPELAAQYTHSVDALDTKRLAAEHPDEFRAHRARRMPPAAHSGPKLRRKSRANAVHAVDACALLRNPRKHPSRARHMRAPSLIARRPPQGRTHLCLNPLRSPPQRRAAAPATRRLRHRSPRRRPRPQRHRPRSTQRPSSQRNVHRTSATSCRPRSTR